MEGDVEREQAAADSRQIVQLIKERLARTVRSNTKKDAALTPLHATSSLPGFSLDKRRVIADEIAADSRYWDIKTVTTSGGLVFLYSTAFISPAEATVKATLEQTKFLISAKVRKDSRDRLRLTAFASIQAVFPELGAARLRTTLDEMQAEPRYLDLKNASGCDGAYFYSDMYMTDKYAALLARAVGKDACAVVVDTVREESQVYPRPTNVQVFKNQIYGIPYNALETTIAGVLQNPEYPDIRKLVDPATGAVYLYSDQHLNELDALSAIRYAESGQR
jgi:hypothetical protein